MTVPAPHPDDRTGPAATARRRIPPRPRPAANPTSPPTVWILDPGQSPRAAVEARLGHHTTPDDLRPELRPSAPASPRVDLGGRAARTLARPFWADMVSDHADSHAGPSREDPTESVDPSGDRHTATPLQIPASGQARVSLVVVEQGSHPAGDELGRCAAQALAPGGLLAVLSHHSRVDGALVDPTGSIVASAQNADLLYLQHIALATPPAITPRVPDPCGASGTESLIEALDTGGEHTDLCLFLRPGHTTAEPATVGAETAASATGIAQFITHLDLDLDLDLGSAA